MITDNPCSSRFYVLTPPNIHFCCRFEKRYEWGGKSGRILNPFPTEMNTSQIGAESCVYSVCVTRSSPRWASLMLDNDNSFQCELDDCLSTLPPKTKFMNYEACLFYLFFETTKLYTPLISSYLKTCEYETYEGSPNLFI